MFYFWLGLWSPGISAEILRPKGKCFVECLKVTCFRIEFTIYFYLLFRSASFFSANANFYSEVMSLFDESKLSETDSSFSILTFFFFLPKAPISSSDAFFNLYISSFLIFSSYSLFLIASVIVLCLASFRITSFLSSCSNCSASIIIVLGESGVCGMLS